MGAWGVRSKESDFGLDLLNLISKEQLFKVDFAYFNVAEGIALLEDYNRRTFGIEKKMPEAEAGQAETCIEYTVPSCIDDALLLIAECVADYYCDGQFEVHDFWSEPDKLTIRHIKEIIITDADRQKLLDCLRRVLDPKSDQYNSWVDAKTTEEWKNLINEHIRLIETHSKQ